MTLQTSGERVPIRLMSARIISAADAEALELSATTLRSAKEEAAALLARASAEAKVKRADAEAEGRREGIHRFQAALFAVEGERSSLRDAVTSEAIAHVFAVIQELIPHLPKEAVTESLVRDLLARARGTSAIELRVNPDQLEFVQSSLKGWIEDASMPVLLKSDPTLKLDECVVMSESGSLKASLKEQIDALEQTIRANLQMSKAA